MSLYTCAACTTPYASDLDACPHCGSSDYTEDGRPVTKRLPVFVSVSCTVCTRGPWQVRLSHLTPGLIQLPSLFCASCGSQVQLPWPPVEETMSPKITVGGGATNAREEAAPSPDATASQPLVGAEADQGHPTPADETPAAVYVGEHGPESVELPFGDETPEPDAAPADDYDGMTLAELRDEASSRGLASYGTKAQITERLRADDTDDVDIEE